MQVVPEGRIYHKHITNLKLQSYAFVLHYAEELQESIAEFVHCHPLYQIYYVVENRLRIDVDGSALLLRENEFVMLSKGVQHHVIYEPDRKKRYFSLVFDIVPATPVSNRGPDGDNEFKDIRAVLSELESRGHILSDRPFDAQGLLEAILREQKGKRAGWNTCLIFHYYRFFIEALRHIATKEPLDSRPSGKLNLAIEATKYIHKNYYEAISLESAAEHLNISPRHVNRAYRTMFGTTFIKNLNRLRIEYAKIYLCTTAYSIDRISELVGFSSSRAFFKLFKEYEGISISQYREEHYSPEP
ncbi:MAG: AraC family transcriptional regulator [Clostridiales Family XIII bacterium]|jgi:AraC-like DNA-binding protein|nr:AraC family transcriptional regulator [Clostridiales Family XIII bacterium]